MHVHMCVGDDKNFPFYRQLWLINEWLFSEQNGSEVQCIISPVVASVCMCQGPACKPTDFYRCSYPV